MTTTVEELAELLLETGHHHHQAYVSSDGVDPEWALWYADYLQTRLWDGAGSLPTRHGCGAKPVTPVDNDCGRPAFGEIKSYR